MSDWIDVAADDVLSRLAPRLRDHFPTTGRWKRFRTRLGNELPSIFRNMHRLYGWRWDFAFQLENFVQAMAESAGARPKRLRRLDDGGSGWMHDPSTVWAMAYVDRFCGDVAGIEGTIEHLRSLGVTHLHLMPPYLTPDGPNDGGYAVSDYRRLRPSLGTMEELERAIERLAEAGIDIVLDFVLNHTADDHAWAELAKQGDPRHRAFYLIFDDRARADRFVPHLRAIFPERGGDAFTWRSDVTGPDGGAWVWTTFYTYQWDLDYRNPDVLTAMAGELGYVANLGPAVIRADATPFVWKVEGTDCENLPETHVVIELLASFLKVAAPGVELLSEAIVHPDEVARFVRAEECRLGYNPLVMSTIWEALATRDVSLLAYGLQHRSALPEGCQWITYLRCHDDIGWGFADEDARHLGFDPAGHRRFLNSFYSGEFADSFATGERFQDNPVTGDARMSGTLASLAGLESALASADAGDVDLAVRRILALYSIMFTAVGIPLLFLGDEVGQLNDNSYRDDPLLAADNRWMHRPHFDWARLAAAQDGEGPEARILAGVQRMSGARAAIEALESPVPAVIDAGNRSLLAYRRVAGETEFMAVVNLSGGVAATSIELGPGWWDAFDGAPCSRLAPLDAYEYRWLVRGSAPST